jgi:hypothetical protein
MHMCSEWSHPLTFSEQNVVGVPHLFHACYMPFQSRKCICISSRPCISFRNAMFVVVRREIVRIRPPLGLRKTLNVSSMNWSECQSNSVLNHLYISLITEIVDQSLICGTFGRGKRLLTYLLT